MKKTVTFFISLVVTFLLFTPEFTAQIQNGEIGITLSGGGRIRIYEDSITSTRQIDRLSILVGSGAESVFTYNEDADVEESVITVENPQISDFEITGAANNSYSNLPPNVLSRANIYLWQTGAYALVKYTVVNREDTDMSAVLGMETIAMINASYGLETSEWLEEEEIVSLYRTGESAYVGFKILSSDITTVSMIDWYDSYDTLDTDLWGWITAAEKDTLLESGGDGAVVFFSQEPVNISAGDSVVFWVGIAFGNGEAEMISNMDMAVAKYSTITDADDAELPLLSAFELMQNYPNPFNPSTNIRFSIPQSEFVTLKIFDVLGNEISTLINGQLTPGSYDVIFNPTNISSGIYFYQLVTENYSKTKKMNLLK